MEPKKGSPAEVGGRGRGEKPAESMRASPAEVGGQGGGEEGGDVSGLGNGEGERGGEEPDESVVGKPESVEEGVVGDDHPSDRREGGVPGEGGSDPEEEVEELSDDGGSGGGGGWMARREGVGPWRRGLRRGGGRVKVLFYNLLST